MRIAQMLLTATALSLTAGAASAQSYDPGAYDAHSARVAGHIATAREIQAHDYNRAADNAARDGNYRRAHTLRSYGHLRQREARHAYRASARDQDAARYGGSAY